MSTTVKYTGNPAITMLLLGGQFRLREGDVATLTDAEMEKPEVRSAISQGVLTVVTNVVEGEATEVVTKPARSTPKPKVIESDKDKLVEETK